MKIYFNNQKFTGYSDIYTGKDKKRGIDFSFITIKMDNVDSKTLNLFKEYKELVKSKDYGMQDDIITISLFENKKNNAGDLFLNNNFLYSVYDLKKIPEQLNKSKNPEKIKLLEKINLKAYTLMAALTKNIINQKHFEIKNNIDKNKSAVELGSDTLLESMFNTFLRISGENFAKEGIYLAILPKSQQNKRDIAKNINQYIARNMEILFK